MMAADDHTLVRKLGLSCDSETKTKFDVAIKMAEHPSSLTH